MRENKVMEEETAEQLDPELHEKADQRAKERSNAARWNLDVAVFLFGVLIIVIILLFQGIGIGIVAPVAIFGLAMVWLAGWRQGRQLYPRFYNEEVAKLEQELSKTTKDPTEQTLEETVEEKVQKALRERWR